MRSRRVAVVTGATGGIGSAFARSLARSGFDVVIVGNNPTKLAEINASLCPGDHTEARLDVTVPGDMIALTELISRRYGRADVLVASAGIGQSRERAGQLPLATKDLPLSEWNAVLDVNLTGTFLCNRAVLSFMRKAEQGVIVNIGSSTTPQGLRGRPLASAYSASKFAMLEYTDALAVEVAPIGIHVIAIMPGSVETPLISGTLLDAPFGGKMDADHFADAVVALTILGREMELSDPYFLPMPSDAQTKQSEQESHDTRFH